MSDPLSLSNKKSSKPAKFVTRNSTVLTPTATSKKEFTLALFFVGTNDNRVGQGYWENDNSRMNIVDKVAREQQRIRKKDLGYPRGKCFLCKGNCQP